MTCLTCGKDVLFNSSKTKYTCVNRQCKEAYRWWTKA